MSFQSAFQSNLKHGQLIHNNNNNTNNSDHLFFDPFSCNHPLNQLQKKNIEISPNLTVPLQMYSTNQTHQYQQLQVQQQQELLYQQQQWQQSQQQFYSSNNLASQPLCYQEPISQLKEHLQQPQLLRDGSNKYYNVFENTATTSIAAGEPNPIFPQKFNAISQQSSNNNSSSQILLPPCFSINTNQPVSQFNQQPLQQQQQQQSSTQSTYPPINNYNINSYSLLMQQEQQQQLNVHQQQTQVEQQQQLQHCYQQQLQPYQFYNGFSLGNYYKSVTTNNNNNNNNKSKDRSFKPSFLVLFPDNNNDSNTNAQKQVANLNNPPGTSIRISNSVQLRGLEKSRSASSSFIYRNGDHNYDSSLSLLSMTDKTKEANSPGGQIHRMRDKAALWKESIAEMGRCQIKNRNELMDAKQYYLTTTGATTTTTHEEQKQHLKTIIDLLKTPKTDKILSKNNQNTHSTIPIKTAVLTAPTNKINSRISICNHTESLDERVTAQSPHQHSINIQRNCLSRINLAMQHRNNYNRVAFQHCALNQLPSDTQYVNPPPLPHRSISVDQSEYVYKKQKQQQQQYQTDNTSQTQATQQNNSTHKDALTSARGQQHCSLRQRNNHSQQLLPSPRPKILFTGQQTTANPIAVPENNNKSPSSSFLSSALVLEKDLDNNKREHQQQYQQEKTQLSQDDLHLQSFLPCYPQQQLNHHFESFYQQEQRVSKSDSLMESFDENYLRSILDSRTVDILKEQRKFLRKEEEEKQTNRRSKHQMETLKEGVNTTDIHKKQEEQEGEGQCDKNLTHSQVQPQQEQFLQPKLLKYPLQKPQEIEDILLLGKDHTVSNLCVNYPHDNKGDGRNISTNTPNNQYNQTNTAAVLSNKSIRSKSIYQSNNPEYPNKENSADLQKEAEEERNSDNNEDDDNVSDISSAASANNNKVNVNVTIQQSLDSKSIQTPVSFAQCIPDSMSIKTTQFAQVISNLTENNRHNKHKHQQHNQQQQCSNQNTSEEDNTNAANYHHHDHDRLSNHSLSVSSSYESLSPQSQLVDSHMIIKKKQEQNCNIPFLDNIQNTNLTEQIITNNKQQEQYLKGWRLLPAEQKKKLASNNSRVSTITPTSVKKLQPSAGYDEPINSINDEVQFCVLQPSNKKNLPLNVIKNSEDHKNLPNRSKSHSRRCVSSQISQLATVSQMQHSTNDHNSGYFTDRVTISPNSQLSVAQLHSRSKQQHQQQQENLFHAIITSKTCYHSRNSSQLNSNGNIKPLSSYNLNAISSNNLQSQSNNSFYRQKSNNNMDMSSLNSKQLTTKTHRNTIGRIMSNTLKKRESSFTAMKDHMHIHSTAAAVAVPSVQLNALLKLSQETYYASGSISARVSKKNTPKHSNNNNNNNHGYLTQITERNAFKER